MNKVIVTRATLEQFTISRLGYAVREFQEDNNITGSWAYTLGLRGKLEGEYEDTDICVFARASVPAELLNVLLSETCERIKEHGVRRETQVSGILTVEGSDSPIRIRLKKTPSSMIEKLVGEGLIIEGQQPNTIYYWLMIADSNNKLPFEEGYTDFKQMKWMQDNMEETELFSDFEE